MSNFTLPLLLSYLYLPQLSFFSAIFANNCHNFLAISCQFVVVSYNFFTESCSLQVCVIFGVLSFLEAPVSKHLRHSPPQISFPPPPFPETMASKQINALAVSTIETQPPVTPLVSSFGGDDGRCGHLGTPN